MSKHPLNLLIGLLALPLVACQGTGAADVAYDGEESGLDSEDVQAALDELADELAAARTELTAQGAQIDDLDPAAFEARIAALEEAEAVQDAALLAHASDIDTLDGAISENDAAIVSLIGGLAAHAAAIDTHTVEIDTNSTNISTNAGDISTNAANIAAGASALGALAADLGLLQAEVDANVTVRTRLNYTGNPTLSPTFSYIHVRDVGEFVKVAAETDVQLTWNSHVTMVGTAGQFCDYQLRVDDFADDSSGGRAVNYGSTAIAVETVFEGLATGPHTVSLWLRGSATSCEENDGNFGRTVWVEEAPAF